MDIILKKNFPTSSTKIECLKIKLWQIEDLCMLYGQAEAIVSECSNHKDCKCRNDLFHWDCEMVCVRIYNVKVLKSCGIIVTRLYVTYMQDGQT